MPSSLSCILSAGLDQIADHKQLEGGTLKAAAGAGFDALLWRMPDDGMAEAFEEDLCLICDDAGAKLLLDVDISLFPIEHPLVAKAPGLFAVRRHNEYAGPIDPRVVPRTTGQALARLHADGAEDVLLPVIADQLGSLLDSGVQGFRFQHPEKMGSDFLAALIALLRLRKKQVMVIVSSHDDVRCLRGVELDGIVSPFGSKNLRAAWFFEDRVDLRSVAPLVIEVSAALTDASMLMAAAASGDGLILPLEVFQSDPALAGHAAKAVRQAALYNGDMRVLSGSVSAVTALLRANASDVRDASAAQLMLINATATVQPLPDPSLLLAAAGTSFEALDDDAHAALEAGEVRVVLARRAAPILLNAAVGGAVAAARAPRLVVEVLSPQVDGGFPVKRVTGEPVTVDATIFADGHEQLAAELLWRCADSAEWTVVQMEELPNSLWRAGFAPLRLGRHEFVVEAWLDRFGGFTRDFRKKLDAGVAVSVDYAEGRLLVEEARDRASGSLKERLAAFAERLATDDMAALLLSADLAEAMAIADDRPHRLRSVAQPLDAERLSARYSSWYELFPRSQADGRHGTFTDVIARLPAIRDMGFDTLYFPPIHPIGTTNRKGPNNTLTPAPGDPGSPYAIGAAEGGHEAIHPELGGLEDFLELIAAARAHGLEIAIDFAIQCSPDHPWLKDHPGWFAWRPDGSMKYAENPPKKYQDIVNVDFYGPDAVPGLWIALRDIVLLWVERGVKTFRVDNPHTKPLPFWEWMIGEVRARHPEVIFLAEAFTRPAMMYRLAKIGFSQSYTYFTWRDGKAELTDYITELTTTAPKEFYRPHFFVNTPDINPLFLQTSGRAGFRIRAVLAATLSGLFGVYSGFELCEAAPVPGKEEYLDSEKFELRPRDWTEPGNIIADIKMLNGLRRAHPALQTHLNTRFYAAYNDNILYYAKPAADGSDMILVMVSLDPHHPQDAYFEVPLWEFGLSDTASIAVEDLAEGYRFDWHGKTQHIRLDPDQPFRIWRIAPGAEA